MKVRAKNANRVLLADIAAAAGVSIPTVSHVLSNRASQKRISRSLEAKIKKIAERIGYRPNLIARSLSTRKSQTIGFLVPNLGKSFYPAILAQAHKRLREQGYLMLLANHYMDPQLFHEEINALMQRSVDAVILGPIPNSGDQANRALEDLMAQCPVIALEWNAPGCDCILNHPQTLGRDAAEYLLEKGATRALTPIITGNHHLLLHGSSKIAKERYQAFQSRFCSQTGNQSDIWTVPSPEDLISRIQKMGSQKYLEKFDSFFFPQRFSGELFLEEIQEIGWDVSHKFAVMISGEAYFPSLRRRVAILHQDPTPMGEYLAERTLLRVQNHDLAPEIIDVPARILERLQNTRSFLAAAA